MPAYFCTYINPTNNLAAFRRFGYQLSGMAQL